MSVLHLANPVGQQPCELCHSLTGYSPFVNHLGAAHGPVHADELARGLEYTSACPILVGGNRCNMIIVEEAGVYASEMMARAAVRTALVMAQRKRSLSNAAIAGGAALGALSIGAFTGEAVSRTIDVLLDGQSVKGAVGAIISSVVGIVGSVLVAMSVHDAVDRRFHGNTIPVGSIYSAVLSSTLLLLPPAKDPSAIATALASGALAYLGIVLGDLDLCKVTTSKSITAGVFGGILGGTIAIASDLSPLTILVTTALSASAIAGAWSQMRGG